MENKSERKREAKSEIRRYFVDEGGDSTLFASKGKVIIDTPGCSRFFILGLLDVLEPERLKQDFDELRTRLMNDPYFTNVPSMQLNGQKTAVDYFTWALQRLYERGEDRYVTFLWSAFRMVQDIGDTREAGYGVYYTQKKPLNAAALEWRIKNEKPGI